MTSGDTTGAPPFTGPRLSQRIARLGGVVVATAGLILTASIEQADAGSGISAAPQAFNQETASGFTNTFTPPATSLSPDCPNGISGTPGSDPASLALNTALNDASSFVTGGQIHYVYKDNPHSSAFNFTIQTCEVAYPASFFAPSDFDPSTGVLINTSFTKQDLDLNGTPIDGASLDGISDPQGNIYFSWTVQPVPNGTWICNFARDIRDNHSGGGNRKVTPVCAQVNAFQDVSVCKDAGPNVHNGETFQFAATEPTGYAVRLPIAAGTCATLQDVPFGQLTIKEHVPSPYEVQNIDVTPSSSTVVSHRLAGKVIVSVGADPTTVTYTNERFVCEKVGGGVDSSGLRYKQYNLSDPEGIASIEGRQVHDASITVSPFSSGTTDAVTVTVTRTSAGTPGHAIVFEQNSDGVYHHCDPTV